MLFEWIVCELVFVYWWQTGGYKSCLEISAHCLSLLPLTIPSSNPSVSAATALSPAFIPLCFCYLSLFFPLSLSPNHLDISLPLSSKHVHASNIIQNHPKLQILSWGRLPFPTDPLWTSSRLEHIRQFQCAIRSLANWPFYCRVRQGLWIFDGA